MSALRWWFIARRESLSDARTRTVDAALLDLCERDRQLVEAWLAGALDRELCERFATADEYLGVLRRELLEDVAARLARRPAKPRRQPGLWEGEDFDVGGL